MSNIIYRIGNKVILFIALILLTNLNLSAQYKLELDWQKDTEWITSITKSDNDSLLYVAFQGLIVTVKTSDGTITKKDSVNASYNLIMSKDGKTLVASSGGGVGMLDPITFKQNFWDYTLGSNYLSLNLNEKQNKFVISGTSGFIKVYDVNSKSLFKEFKPSDVRIKNAKLTYDGKFIVYSYIIEKLNPYELRNYVKMIDIEGKVVKDFGETSSTNFSLTNDGKTLIYFMSDAIHFFDLATMKEIEGIPSGGLNPAGIEMSRDGKIMLLGFTENSKITNSLIYCNLEAKNYFILQPFGSWDMFRLNNDNSSLFSFVSDLLYKFNIVPTTSISADQNKLELQINIFNNKLILSNPQNHQINTLTAYDILGRTYPLSANGNEVDVSGLAAGKYFLKVGLADGSFFDFGFVKE